MEDQPSDVALGVPRRSDLYQNVPNPFNQTTQIRFDLAPNARVALRIYDVAGRLTCTLLDKDMVASCDHSVVWNGPGQEVGGHEVTL